MTETNTKPPRDVLIDATHPTGYLGDSRSVQFLDMDRLTCAISHRTCLDLLGRVSFHTKECVSIRELSTRAKERNKRGSVRVGCRALRRAFPANRANS